MALNGLNDDEHNVLDRPDPAKGVKLVGGRFLSRYSVISVPEKNLGSPIVQMLDMALPEREKWVAVTPGNEVVRYRAAKSITVKVPGSGRYGTEARRQERGVCRRGR
jgi:hypothetical protein